MMEIKGFALFTIEVNKATGSFSQDCWLYLE